MSSYHQGLNRVKRDETEMTFRNLHRVLLYGMDSRETPQQWFSGTGEGREQLGPFTSSHWLGSSWHLVDEGGGSATQGRMVLCPMGLSKVPLDIGVGEKPVYNHLNRELKPILWINAKECLHGFNKHSFPGMQLLCK